MLSYLLQQLKRKKKKETRLLDAKYVISMRRISCISDSCQKNTSFFPLEQNSVNIY